MNEREAAEIFSLVHEVAGVSISGNKQHLESILSHIGDKLKKIEERDKRYLPVISDIAKFLGIQEYVVHNQYINSGKVIIITGFLIKNNKSVYIIEGEKSKEYVDKLNNEFGEFFVEKE